VFKQFPYKNPFEEKQFISIIKESDINSDDYNYNNRGSIGISGSGRFIK
jgi:hypothetical protein